MNKLANYLEGRWQEGAGAGSPVLDPVTGETLATVGADGIDMAAAYAFARNQGGTALRALSYAQRAELLGAIVKVLQANRDKYFDISLKNSGTVQNDSAVDVDGGIYTLSYYAKLGGKLTAGQLMADGTADALARDNAFATQHILVPVRGLALFINAFNFPSWGLWEKAAAALLSGVPVVIKPASATAWLTHEMVKDVIDAGILPGGALNIVCGRPANMLEALDSLDVVSFTGSADTAASLRNHPKIKLEGVRFNAETDSVNSALLGPDADDDAMGLLVREVVRELTIKSGQKCTAIRRILVPQARYATVAAALADKLKGITVGDPRLEGIRMGSLVSASQRDAIVAGIQKLEACSDIVFDGRQDIKIQAEGNQHAIVPPVVFGTQNPDTHPLVHEMEVFGPVATLMPYRDTDHALALARRGMGSLVASVYSNDPDFLAQAAISLAESHGRVHLINNDVAKVHTGHGNVMPQSNHGGPGRAGGGEELGGLRALRFYHRLSAVQGAPGVLEKIVN
ncbi:3,4-dehydroadipyl-CoA semialdehyde dehydrogenase [Pusillimonas minor]|uniref:3,4-dehydroadipyl-CoA semialdehyde dehydrogenase n=1 Tax=Pusillimonas minor TaxID=2697024 RepID=A0A842HPW2_9BURK|nr:3,4-dehydroadipyl-CoA semialdehyde dehydrogenase [Pusillimonas minor]MBC2769732.1 3,4-dehydroadipyl-CoA semialdehyde dehydrogenase [Pusillimonas minor]